MSLRIVVGVVVLLFVAAVGCGGAKQESAESEVQTEPVIRATAYINPRSGSDLGGSAIFINNGTQVELQITLKQAPPGGHAVHIHEVGDCSAEDASSAGGHWNPTGADHGKWDTQPFHLGDIGNIVVDDEGEGSLSLVTDRWTLGGGADNDVLGKSVVVHVSPDDFTSQPSGAAGARIGCGVINAG